MWVVHFHNGEHHTALDIAKRFRSVALQSGDAENVPVADRTIGHLYHLLGDVDRARDITEAALRSLEQLEPEARIAQIGQFQLDQATQTRITLAHLLWLQGFPDQARKTAEANVTEARSGGHALSLANALTQIPCPIALLTGDLDAMADVIAALFDCARENNLPHYVDWARCFDAALVIRRGDAAGGTRALRAALEHLRGAHPLPRDMILVAELARALSQDREDVEALAVIDEALDRCERTAERWWVAELLRTKGEIVLQDGRPDGEAIARQCFLEAPRCSREQGAVSLELRAAMSLVRLNRQTDESRQAREPLAPVFVRFTEGFETVDLREAKALLSGR